MRDQIIQYFGVVIVLTALLTALPGIAHTPTNERKSTQQNSTEVINRRAAPASERIQNYLDRIARALEAANVHPYVAREQQRAEEEMEAQTKTARWAKVMLFIASAETAVTMIGVILVGLTLRASHATAKDAKRSADEARRQADAAEAALRPHLFIENIHLGESILRNWFDLTDADFAAKRVDVFYTVANYGRSPGIIRELKGGIYIGKTLPESPSPYDSDVWTDEIVIPVDDKSQKKGQFFFFYRDRFTKEALHELFLGRSYDPDRTPTKMFFYVEIRYEGTFRSLDQIGVLWEYLVDIDRWIQRRDIPNYTYRLISQPPQNE